MKIYLIGFMGSGKTTLGRRVAKKLNLQFIDMDSYIERKEYRAIPEIFSKDGEDIFRQIEHDTLKELLKKDNCIIATGGGSPCYFNNIDLMNETGITIYLKLSVETLAQRLRDSTTKRPLIENKTQKELSAYIKETLQKREPYYTQAQHIIKNDNIKPQDILSVLQ